MTESCTHCGLPVPLALVGTALAPTEARAEKFCCHGCRAVYEILHTNGLETYYDLRDAEQPTVSETDRRPSPTGRDYEEFDDRAFLDIHASERDGLTSVPLLVEGLHCGACVWLLERIPSLLPGVREVRVDFGKRKVTVVWDPAQQSLSRVARLIDDLGYRPHPFRGSNAELVRERENRKFLIRIGVAGACAGNVMLIAFTLYGGDLQGMDSTFREFFRWVSLGLTLPVLWAGSVFFRGARAGIRARTLSMDLPIAVGLAAGFSWSAFNTMRGTGEIYFDSVTALVFLLLAGRWLQTKQQQRAGSASELLHALSPPHARRLTEAGEQVVAVESLREGDVVRVLPGDLVPADGEILRGVSTFDRSLLTGESTPATLQIGSEAHAGVRNLSTPVELRVGAIGEQTRVGQLLALVEEHASRKPKIVRAADRVSSWFVGTVLIVATATLAAWSFVDPALAVDHTLALLVITCPCALGLATPLAITAAIGAAARRGILVKGGDALEALASTRSPHRGIVWFDKTGTLTEGALELITWTGDDEVLADVAALQRSSHHPLALAWCRAAEAADLDPARSATEVRQIDGLGIAGQVRNSLVVAGNAELARRTVGVILDFWQELIDEAAERGQTPVVVLRERRIVGIATFGDRARDGAKDSVRALRESGWQVGLLSGDHRRATEYWAREIGIDSKLALGERSPEEKLELIREGAKREPTIMVGDGVNDAAALAAATVGIAVRGGTEAALSAADIALTTRGVADLPALFNGARRARRTIVRNLTFSLGYNVIGAGLSIAGLVHPLVAAVLMPVSSLTVIVHSFRARTFEAAASTAAGDTGTSRATPVQESEPVTTYWARATPARNSMPEASSVRSRAIESRADLAEPATPTEGSR